jgi:hypothetical protein
MLLPLLVAARVPSVIAKSVLDDPHEIVSRLDILRSRRHPIASMAGPQRGTTP